MIFRLGGFDYIILPYLNINIKKQCMFEPL